MKKYLSLLFLLLFIFLWIFSLNSLRTVLADSIIKLKKEVAINLYVKTIRKDLITFGNHHTSIIGNSNNITKLKYALASLDKESFYRAGQLIPITGILKNNRTIYDKLTFLCYFNPVFGNNVSTILTWTAQKRSIDSLINIYGIDGQEYLTGWVKSELSIQGNWTVSEGPWLNSKALVINYSVNPTRILAPERSVNVADGAISLWARFLDYRRPYSSLITIYSDNRNDWRTINLYHQGVDGRFCFYYDGHLISYSSVPIKDDLWHHFVLTWKDKEQLFYIDGLPVLLGKADVLKNRGTNQFAIGWIGDNYDTQQWAGSIANLYVFDHFLDSQEIRRLFDSENCRLGSL